MKWNSKHIEEQKIKQTTNTHTHTTQPHNTHTKFALPPTLKTYNHI